MINKKLALDLLNTCLTTGGDYAEIYLEKRITNSYRIDNGLSEKPGANYDYGVGIRIMKELQSVYGYTNKISKSALTELAQNLAASFKGKQTLKVSELITIKVRQNSKVQTLNSEISKADKITLLRGANEIMRNYDPRIVRAICALSEEQKEITIFNSNGKELHDTRTYTRMAFSALASENGQIESDFEGPGAQQGFEFVKSLDIEGKARETARVAVALLSAKECPSGKMPVILGNGFGGVLFHEACGHSLEASSVSKELSVFSGKKGQQIASELVNAFDDGTISNAWGSINIDDEGNYSERTQLIKNGILNEYMIDMFNGRRMNAKPNGHSRRQNYRFEPTSRMTNTYIDNGTSSVEEIIQNTKLGLYAKSLGGGSVNPTTGEFNFGCSEAYIVRDGKVAELVKGAVLIGTGEEILRSIDMIANDLTFAQGMCGAESGSIPTIVGQPTLRVKSMTVGGRGGELK